MSEVRVPYRYLNLPGAWAAMPVRNSCYLSFINAIGKAAIVAPFLDNDFVIGEESDKIPQDDVAAGKVSMVTLARDLGNHPE